MKNWPLSPLGVVEVSRVHAHGAKWRFKKRMDYNSYNIVYVTLWDPECIEFDYYFGSSLRDVRLMIHWNVVLTIFRNNHKSQGLCKLFTFHCHVVLQLRGEGPEILSQICATVQLLFRSFSPRLENNNPLKCSFVNNVKIFQYVVIMDNFGTVFQCNIVLQSWG